MPRPYSEDLRSRVIMKRDEGKTVMEIVNELNVKKTFVYDIIKIHTATGSVKPKQAAGGRPPVIDETELLQIEALIYETPDITLAEIKETLNLSASISVICNAINNKLDLRYKKRPCLTADKTERMYKKPENAGKMTNQKWTPQNLSF